MKKLYILVALLLASALTALAGPARPGTFTHTQKDGTVITLQRFGDEFYHYTLADGQYAVKMGADGDYYFATRKNGLYVASDVKFAPVGKLNQQQRTVAQQSVGLRPTPAPNTNGSLRDMIQAQAERIVANEDGSLPSNFSLGRWGADRNQHMDALVILVEYQDVKFKTPNTNEAFYNMLNQDGYSENGGTGSAKNYFEANSNGKFTIDIDVAGPYTLAQDMAFYGGNDAAYYDQDSLPDYMVVEGCKLAQDAGDVTDFTKYDNDSDGYIDMVFIIYAGTNEAEGGPEDSVWPHKSEIGQFPSSYQTVYDGKKLKVYACTSELSGKGDSMCGIGTFCHEFSHVLGLPDVYDTDYGTPQAFGLSYASIMGGGSYLNGGKTPPSYNIFERWMLGWGQPTVINKSGAYTLESVYGDNGYLLWANNEKSEFFLFENRNKAANVEFGWDKFFLYGDSYYGYEGGEGMLVYHVDCSNKSIWSTNSLNANHNHEYVKLFRADPAAGDADSKDWFYPGGKNIFQLTDKTTPALLNWNNEKLKYNIENINFDGENVHFEVVEVIISKEVGQYDALIQWNNSEHTATYTQWQVSYTDHNGEAVVVNTDNTYVHISMLQPETAYEVSICGLKGGAASEVLHSVALTTEPNVRVPMSMLNMNSEYASTSFVKLSVANLECTPDNIDWYVNGKKSTNTYAQMARGEHQICAVITDTEGKTHYLYRYITVK